MQAEHDLKIAQLVEHVEGLEHDCNELRIAIREHVEALGHSGNDPTALADALGQIMRLLDGKDLDASIDFVGVAGCVQTLMRQVSKAPRFPPDTRDLWRSVFQSELAQPGVFVPDAIDAADGAARAMAERYASEAWLDACELKSCST